MKNYLATIFILCLSLSVYSQCGVPQNTFSNNIHVSSANLNWSTVNYVYHYKIRYKEINSTSWWYKNNIDSTLTSMVLHNLSDSSTYIWQIRTHCDSLNNNYSNYSQVDTFTTLGRSSLSMWDNFENYRCVYYDFHHGGLITRYANPDNSNSFYNSPICAKYLRNPSELYDVIKIFPNGLMYDVSDYVNGNKVMSLDVYSPSPGIPIQITLEDSSIAGPTNYPTGRHSIYLGQTTVANAWEKITLTFDSQPDPTVSDLELTSLILLFNPGINSNDTFYFDNLNGPSFDNQCDGLIESYNITKIADWDCNWELGICPSNSSCSSFDFISGWLDQSYNPDTNSINSSKYCGSYTRNPSPNGIDILTAYLKNRTLDSNDVFQFKLYGPQSPFSISFRDTSNNEVLHYSSSIINNNNWQEFSINLSSLGNNNVSNFILKLDSGMVNFNTYYIDDFQILSSFKPLELYGSNCVSGNPGIPISSNIWVENTTNYPIDVICEKIIIDTALGTQNYFCWGNGSTCWPSTTYISQLTNTTNPNSFNNDFVGYYDAIGSPAQAIVKYCFYPDGYPQDSSCKIISYNSSILCPTISGCTDPTAPNWNPSATIDDGSCFYSNCGNNNVQICGTIIDDIDCNGNLSNINIYVDNDTSSLGSPPAFVAYQLRVFKPGFFYTVPYLSSSITTGSNIIANGLTEGFYYALVVDSLAFVAAFPAPFFSNSQFINNVLTDPSVYNYDTIIILEPQELSNTITTQTINQCFGFCDASELISISGGTQPYLVDGNPISGTDTLFDNLCAGTYSFTVTDANGCATSPSSPSAFTVTEPNVLSVNGSVTSNYSGQDISCFGASDGEITAAVTSGTAPYEYSLDNILWTTNPVFSNLSSGTYTLYYRDANLCNNYEIFILNDPDSLDISYSINCPTSINSNDGIIDFSTSGGVMPYLYSLDGGSTWWYSSIFNNLGNGTYVIIVADANGCTKNDIVNLNFGCSDPIASNYDSTIVCYDSLSCIYCDLYNNFIITDPSDSISCDGFIIANSFSSFPISSYSWTDLNGITLSSNNYLLNVCNGVYIFTSIDSVGCNFTDTLIVGSILGCTDSTALNFNIYASIDDGSCSYPSIYGCTDPLAYNYDSLANTDDGSCLYCDLTNTMIVSQNTTGNCNGLILATSFSSNPPIFYLWNTGSTLNNISNLCAGTYSVIISDNVGCTIEDTVYMNVVPGCMDPTALNYDPLATVDDGSCTYSSNCNSPKPTGLFAFDVIDTRAKVSWDNMNDPNCMVWKYFVRYREVGTNGWTTKSAGVGNGLCNFGLNTVTKQLLNLTPSTTYEFRMKAFYCGGTSSNYSTPVQFTTADPCPDMTNLTATTFNSNQSKVRFNWDTTGVYTFSRVLLRVDVPGSNWQTAGGFGVYYPTFFVNKFGLTAGENYRAQGRTFCDSNITAYRSPTWTAPIFWTQPGSIREGGGASINNLDVYPNPSRDVFNISFNSDKLQDLSIRILNVVGAEVYREDRQEFVGEYIKQISLDNYGKGIYFLEIETSTGVVNKKLILQ
ncbi:fibronectin type III domain-containing protein [Flavobacteriales bacterium]|nr:fibronectin type III domain-containing protein [Flavobacteriales bacterium]